VKQGGKLMLKMRKLRVKGIPKDFPDTLDIDISALMLGKSIKVGELSFKNLELLDPKNAVVTTVRLTRSAMSAKQQAEGAK
jgi:large subunit ribosomal protein L25